MCEQGCWEKQVSNLVDLIDIINSELTKNDRKKLITLCTIDVHARDVVQRLIDERVENVSCFQWQSQLRYYQNEKTKEAQVLPPSIAPIPVEHANAHRLHIMCSKASSAASNTLENDNHRDEGS